MKVLSLFDGMSCGMLAFMSAGISVDEYHAYEIDKYAVKVSSHNFPEIIHHGDVFDGDYTQYRGFDWLIGGSPCTYWSIAQNPEKRETTASGIGWELFQQYVRALKEAEPEYFLYENNFSMSRAIKDSISEAFGFEPIMINSSLVSAQNRKRLYWVGKRNYDGTYSKYVVNQPNDRKIHLKSILIYDDEYIRRYALKPTLSRQKMWGGGNHKAGDRQKCKNITNAEKSGTVSTRQDRCPNSGLLAYGNFCRTLSPMECARLQNIPDWYDFSVISDTQAYKCIGNGWTVDVIAHLLKSAMQNQTEESYVQLKFEI